MPEVVDNPVDQLLWEIHDKRGIIGEISTCTRMSFDRGRIRSLRHPPTEIITGWLP